MIVISLHNTCHCTYSLANRTFLLLSFQVHVRVLGKSNGMSQPRSLSLLCVSLPGLFCLEVATLYEGWTGGYQGWSGGGKMLWSTLSHVPFLDSVWDLLPALFQPGRCRPSYSPGSTSAPHPTRRTGNPLAFNFDMSKIFRSISSRSCN